MPTSDLPQLPPLDSLLRWQLVAKTLARRAGALVLSMRDRPAGGAPAGSLTIENKSNSSDLVTSADLASQTLIFDHLRAEFPDHVFIGEEDAVQYRALTDAPTWIVDAIDGTTNFVHGLSDFAVSIALAVGKRVVVAVVHNPCVSDTFCAIRGHGSFLNDLPLRASSCAALSDALVISEWGYERTDPAVSAMLAVNARLLTRRVRGVRQLGSGTLDICYVAAGRVDAVYCGVVKTDAWHIWDYAAASLIAEEAGAQMRTLENLPFHIEAPSMVCAAPGLIEELLSVLNE